MRISTILVIYFMLILPTFAHQPDGEQCAKENDDSKRLLCYDLIFKKSVETISTPSSDTGEWKVEKEISKIDDSQNVFLQLYSTDTFQERYKQSARVSLNLQCRENTTFAYFVFGGAFMSDHNGGGNVTMRIDKNKAITRSLRQSSDHRALGYWRGGTSIPFIKSLLDGKQLLLRFAPYNESHFTVTFPISGLREAVKPVADACNWKL